MMASQAYLGAVGGRDGAYSIVFLDFPGCASAGDTMEDVLAMGREALEGHIGVMRDYGDPVPPPTSHTIEDVDAWLYDADEADRDPWVGLFPIEIQIGSDHGDVRVELPRGLIRDLHDTIPDARRFIIDATRRELDRLRKSA